MNLKWPDPQLGPRLGSVTRQPRTTRGRAASDLPRVSVRISSLALRAQFCEQVVYLFISPSLGPRAKAAGLRDHTPRAQLIEQRLANAEAGGHFMRPVRRLADGESTHTYVLSSFGTTEHIAKSKPHVDSRGFPTNGPLQRRMLKLVPKWRRHFVSARIFRESQRHSGPDRSGPVRPNSGRGSRICGASARRYPLEAQSCQPVRTLGDSLLND